MGGYARGVRQEKVLGGANVQARCGDEEAEMTQQVRVIKTQRDYDDALARLSALMGEDLKAGSAKEAELELLALVVEAYERERVAPVSPDPIEAIHFRMEQMGLSKKDLVPYFGSLPKVSEVLSRKRALSLSMIRKLYTGLGIPAEILLRDVTDEVDLSDEPQYDCDKFPWKEMIERGYLPQGFETVRCAKEHCEELIRGFMRELHSAGKPPALLRARLPQSGARVMDEHALLVWQVAVLKKARRQAKEHRTLYAPGAVTQDWLRDLAKLSRFEYGPRLAVEYLADIGIALVIEAHFRKTYLDGAAMLDEAMPVVALTLRHDRIDNFWFTLLHELVHVQKHLKSDNPMILDDLEDKGWAMQAQETEADEGAKNALIPPAEWEASAVRLDPTEANAIALADRLRIAPAIVAGRVRRETDNWRLLRGRAFSGKVRELLRDQLEGVD